jgi:hypothetical protein
MSTDAKPSAGADTLKASRGVTALDVFSSGEDE